MRIRILDRYIFQEVMKTFLFSMCAFTTVFIGSGTLFRIAQYITEYGASFSSIAKIFILSLPGIVLWTFPMSMLLASLLSFGRLSGASEITAMKSCGISFGRIALPALALGLFMSMFSVWFNEYIVPWSIDAYNRVLEYEIKKETAPRSQDHIIIKDIQKGVIQRLLYARRYDADTQRMEGVTVQLFESGKLRHVENAATAEWEKERWVMHDGVIYDIPDGAAGQEAARHTMRFATQVLPVEESPREILNAQKKPESMTIREIKDQIAILSQQHVNTVKLETEMYQRFSIPFASFVFTLIGVPLGLQPNRSSTSRGFMISLIIIFVYYALMTLSGSLGQSGAMPLWLAVWMPNLVGLGAGAFFMKQASE